jgi:fatty-acyl-CoA synthase
MGIVIRRYDVTYMNYVGKPLALVLATPERPDDAANTLRAAFGNEATERMRHGMYWSGDLAYRDADGWIYLAGRTADWMRVDGENLAAGPIERILQRLPAVNHVAVYAVPDEHVGDQVMAAIVLNDDATVTPKQFEEFLVAQPDLSPKAWPRYVRINAALPQTATNKILKRTLIADGVTGGDGVLWERSARGSEYRHGGQTRVP